MPVEMDYGQSRSDRGFGFDGILVECGHETGESLTRESSGGGVCSFTGSGMVEEDSKLISQMGHR